jgi:hypothetical protein
MALRIVVIDLGAEFADARLDLLGTEQNAHGIPGGI